MAPDAQIIRSDPQLVKRAVWLAGILGGLQVSDPIIAYLALPKAGRSLQMGAATLALAASISTLCLAATVVLMGALADRVGRRLMTSVLTAGIVIGDVIVFVAPQTAVFMLGRAVAGICVGGVIATSYAYVQTVSPAHRLGANLGLWAAVSMGLALPLTVVSAGLASVDWRLAFLCLPVVAVVCLFLIPRWLPKIDPAPVKKQLYGVSLAGLGVAAILYGVSRMAATPLSFSAIAPLVTGIGLLAIAAVVGLRSTRPAFPVRIFGSSVFIAAAVSGGLWNLATAVGQLQSSNLWQYANGLEPLAVSLLQLPLNLTLVVGSLVGGRLLMKGSTPRAIISIGFLVVAFGFAGMSLTGASSVTVVFNAALCVVGFGAGAASVAQSQILLTESPAEFVSAVAASRTTFGQVGYALGLAGSNVITSALTIRALDTPAARDELNQFYQSTGQEVADSQALAMIAKLYTSGFGTGMLFWSGLFLVGAIVCFGLLTMRPRPFVPSGGGDFPAPVDA